MNVTRPWAPYRRLITTNRYTRMLAPERIFWVCGRRAVRLDDRDRADFMAMVKIGRRLTDARSDVPPEWVRLPHVGEDVAELVIALVRGWRWAEDIYPVRGQS